MEAGEGTAKLEIDDRSSPAEGGHRLTLDGAAEIVGTDRAITIAACQLICRRSLRPLEG